MNSVITIDRWTQSLVVVAAALATLFTAGGPLMLAEHYARSGASWDASGYHTGAQTRRLVCSDQGDAATSAVSTRNRARNS